MIRGGSDGGGDSGEDEVVGELIGVGLGKHEREEFEGFEGEVGVSVGRDERGP